MTAAPPRTDARRVGAPLAVAAVAADRIHPAVESGAGGAARPTGTPLLCVLGTVVVAYVAGAAVGAALGDWPRSWCPSSRSGC